MTTWKISVNLEKNDGQLIAKVIFECYWKIVSLSEWYSSSVEKTIKEKKPHRNGDVSRRQDTAINQLQNTTDKTVQHLKYTYSFRTWKWSCQPIEDWWTALRDVRKALTSLQWSGCWSVIRWTRWTWSIWCWKEDRDLQWQGGHRVALASKEESGMGRGTERARPI